MRKRPQKGEIASRRDLRMILGKSTRTTMLRRTSSRQSTCPSLLLRRAGSPFPILLSSVTKGLNALCTRIKVEKLLLQGGNPCHVFMISAEDDCAFFLPPSTLCQVVKCLLLPYLPCNLPNISSAFRRFLQHGHPMGNFCY